MKPIQSIHTPMFPIHECEGEQQKHGLELGAGIQRQEYEDKIGYKTLILQEGRSCMGKWAGDKFSFFGFFCKCSRPIERFLLI